MEKRNVINLREYNILERCKKSVCYVLCDTCKSEIEIVNPSYFKSINFTCKYCRGKKFVYIRSETNMIYNGIETKNLKALKCPVCDNEQIYDDGDYCAICGTKLVNECADTYDGESDVCIPSCDKGKQLDGYARFCPYCGNQTTFLQQGILKPVLRKYANSDIPKNDLPF